MTKEHTFNNDYMSEDEQMHQEHREELSEHERFIRKFEPRVNDTIESMKEYIHQNSLPMLEKTTTDTWLEFLTSLQF